MMIDKIKALPEKKALAIGLTLIIGVQILLFLLSFIPLNWHLDYEDH